MRKLLMLMLGCLCITTQLLAQNRSVSGRVTDESGNGIPKASVTVKGTRLGTTTASDGTFTLNVPANSNALLVSSVGFIELEVSIVNQSSITAQLKPVSGDMNEVIVVAYGLAKKGEYTGSSAQVSAKDMENRPLMNVTNALVGAAPGIQTTASNGQPGSSPGIRLRGYTSYSANASPLIVVDGVVYDGGLANINPDDVESLSILKDASTSALYGSRGANGVIIITTKKGRKNRNQLSFKMTHGFSQRGLPEYDRVGPYEYYPLMWESYRNSLAYSGTTPLATASQTATNGIKNLLGYNPFNVANNDIVRTDGTLNPNAQLLWADDLDWSGAATRVGSRKEYAINYNGGTDKSDFYSSFGYTNEKGFLINSDFKRFSGRVSVNTEATNWFKTGFNLSGSMVNSNQANDGSGIVNPFYFSRGMGPIYPIYAHNQTTGAYLLDANGQRFYDFGNLTSIGLPTRPFNTGRHAIAENLWNENLFNRNILSTRAYGTIVFTPELNFTTNIGMDLQDYLGQSYQNKQVGDGAPAGRSSRTSTKTTSYTFNQLLNYAKRFGDHNLSVLAGHENYDLKYNYLYGFAQGQVIDGNTELENFSTINDLTSQTDRSRLESYLSRINYDFDGKYFVSGSFRRDGNSRFYKNVRWDNFWSAGIAWRLDREAFFTVSWVDQLKLRASYGKVGNDGGLGYYPYQALYNLGYNNAQEPGFVQGSLANEELTWETAKSLDFGVDFGFWKNRLSGSIDYFNRVTDGLIFSVPQPLSNGGTNGGTLAVNQNIGSMVNNGIEVQVNGDIIRNRNFNWNMGINWTSFKNEMTKMPDNRQEIIDGTKKIMKGHSIYDYWLRHFYGVDPADGAALYSFNTWNPANSRIIDKGNGQADTVTTDINNAKYFYTGTSAIPDFYGSIQNTLTYKNFSFSFLLTYQVGGQVYDGVYGSLMNAGSYGTALHTDILSRWQKPGDLTTVPRMDNGKVGVFDAASDRWLIDASYLSVNNLNLAYNLPRTLLSRINSSGGRVYVSAENVYFFSKRKGMNVNGSFNGTTGNTYTPNRVISAGINLNF